jgi:hypothetical protein
MHEPLLECHDAHSHHCHLLIYAHQAEPVPNAVQSKADAQVRWAVLNVVTLLRRHERVHDELAEAMQRGASVGECIAVIESQLASSQDI